MQHCRGEQSFHRKGIDTIERAYYTVAHGHGQTTASPADLDTGALVAVTVQDADEGDTVTSVKTLIEAAETIETVVPEGEGLKEVVADKGYHSNEELVEFEAVGVRSCISEPDRGRRNWQKQPAARDTVYRNRRRIHGTRGQRLLRLHGERLERPFAHLYETGAMQSVHLRGHTSGPPCDARLAH